ncbi:MAG: flagellar motor switch protein FliN [Fibrobacterota bacterium]
MNNDMLSQNDIDNLIQGDSEPASGKGGGSIQYDALKAPVGIIAEQVSTVLLTVLGKEISVSTAKIGAADEAKLTHQFGAGSVIIKVDFLQKVNGPLYFVYLKNDVAVLADLMMMGDGSAPYEEDHKDAIVELTNQILGAVTSTFGTTFEAQVSVGTPSIEDFNLASGPALAETTCADLTMRIEDIREVKFALLIPNGTAADLIGISQRSSAATAAPSAGGGSAAGNDAGGFDFNDAAGLASGMPLQSFSQPAGHLANDKASQFSSTGNPQMDMLLDVTLQVAIELGRTEMSIKKILELGPGSIIELDRMAGEPVDLLVNDKVVAKGEVVVVDENFGIRIVKLVSPEERLKNLR